MRRLTANLLLVLALGVIAPGRAGAAADPGPILRHWHLGVQGVSSWRSRFDVFETPGIPSSAVSKHGRGGGFLVGRRFGDRFLLDLQLAFAEHDIAETPEAIHDVEALVTGTVLFRQRDTFQPFLRGGFGAGGEILDLKTRPGNVISFGTTAIAGGGLQIRLSSRFAWELEAVATFTNFLEARNESDDPRWTEDSWQVRESNQGWRVGSGLLVWF